MSKCQHEIEAVKRIRERHPNIPQRTLAYKITNPTFSFAEYVDRDDSYRIAASFATNYNRIRRIDGSIK